MDQKTVYIPSISCKHCVMTIERELMELDGVISVKGDPSTRMVTVQWKSPLTWNGIAQTLGEIGFSPGK